MKLKKFLCFLIILIFSLSFSTPVFAADETVATVKAGDKTSSFTSFEEAWNNAVVLGKSSEVLVTLNGDWTSNSKGYLGSGTGFESGAIFYSGANNLTLDLNGYTINRNLYSPEDYGDVIHVVSNMTIVDSRSDEYTSSKLYKGGTITGGSNNYRGGGIIVSGSGVLNFNGGTVANCVSTDDGAGIYVKDSSAKLIINGGSLYGNRTYDSWGECCGGAIYIAGANVEISNAVFEGNYAEDNGGAIYIDDGSLNIKNSLFYSNSSNEEGGAIYFDGDSKTKIESSTFSRNSANDDGGAIFFDSDNGSYLYDCNMYYNSSTSEGGALHINDDKVFVLGGEYKFNTAKEHGGGIYVDSMYDLNIAGKLIVSNNTANGNADDLCLQDGLVTTAYLYCGGLYEGSSVYLASSDGDSRLAIKEIDKYQYSNYIHFDSKYKQDKVKSSTLSDNDIRAEGSAIGNGNVTYLLVLTAIVVVAIIILIIYKKKKGVKKND